MLNMMGWRRKAKAEREKSISSERLYDLVNQTLLSNFGPLGSYAITRREASDSDDIFHTMLASSVAHNIVTSLIEHNAVVVTMPSAVPVSLAPVDAVPVSAELAAAVNAPSYLRPATTEETVAPAWAPAAELALAHAHHAVAEHAFTHADLAVAELARAEAAAAQLSPATWAEPARSA
ncbi:hypothetical protein D4765_07540 [Subtercola vilae]|uniref:Uncharacterized protein n=2 Tax=Microbacteriaceae TaxID=85023 RepID=A0A4T2C3Y6_9MICO|nr:hypothetical protein D4765_07540 [Subtercola vilae]